MKRITIFGIGIFIAFMVVVSCKSGNSTKNNEENISSEVITNTNTADGSGDTSSLPKFLFDEEVHDFGRIIQGEKVSFSYKFKNVGKSSLLISDAKGSCGCTVADFPQKPIAPGEGGTIDVKFNTDGKKGFQNKTITLIANTQPNTKVLTIKAQIQVPEEDK